MLKDRWEISYKGISKALDIPWNTVRTVIKGEKIWDSDTAKNFYVLLKQKKTGGACQEARGNFIAGIYGIYWVGTHISHIYGLWGRMERSKPLHMKKNGQAQLD